MVVISRKFKLIHIHIPKTGGTSANMWLRELDPEAESLCDRPHESLMHLKDQYPKEFTRCITFAIVRNPWARVVSAYKYRRISTSHQPPHWPSREDIDTMTFREVVLRSVHQNPAYATICPPRDAPEIAWLEPSCSSWLSTGGQLAADYVLRLENIEQDIQVMNAELGLEGSAFPHTNRTNHAPYTEYYDDQTIDIVARRYEDDIKNFGYRFGD